MKGSLPLLSLLLALVSSVDSDVTTTDSFTLLSVVPSNGGLYTKTADDLWSYDENTPVEVILLGVNLTAAMDIYFSPVWTCNSNRYVLNIIKDNITENSLVVSGITPTTNESGRAWICVRESVESSKNASIPYYLASTGGLSIPLSVRCILAAILLVLSGLFSGLNLGLMSLDITTLKILQTSGTKEEQGYANKIEPIRRHGNFLLCTLLLGNVLVNSTLTILLDTLFGGLIAVIGSTAGIVVMGEIIPQAICQRFGLVVGAKTLFITKIFMVLTCPLSWPISKILDKVLGDELGTFYRREQLKELVRLTQDHHGIIGDEFKMISGVLDIKDKQVKDIMTDIRDVFMLNIDTTINFQQLQIIIDKGFSRIPVWEEDDNNIVGLLFVKDLAFVDPENNIPLRSVIKFYKHKATKIYPDCNVFDQMQDFMTGKYHMAIVQEVVNEGSGDPFYKTLGVLTLEDIIEEIIQQEIIDETDVYEDNTNRNKVQRARDRSENPFKLICSSEKSGEVKISRQLRLATFSFLSTSVAEFSEELVSSSILHKLLKQDVIRDADNTTHPLVEHGKPMDAMIMILSGEVVVTIGKEKHQFTQGPFSVFCENALKEKTVYIPDVTVICPEKCQYLLITRQNYRRAVEATCYEKTSNAEIISFSDFANANCDDTSQKDVKINGDKVSYGGIDLEKGSEKSALGEKGMLRLAPIDCDDIVCDERTSCLSTEDQDCVLPASLSDPSSRNV